MIGTTLSGKSFYVKSNYEYEILSLANLNNDRRLELQESERLLNEGYDVVIDDTNLTKKIRKMHIDLAKKYNSKIIGIFMNTSIGLIRQRRWRQSDNIPMVVINKQFKDLEMPEKNEGFDELSIIER